MKQGAAKGHHPKHTGTAKHVHHAAAKHHPKAHKKAAQHHHAKGKPQHVHTVAHHHKGAKPKKQGLAEPRVSAGITPFASRERLDGPAASLLRDVACCTAEAVAASLRLTGRPVSAWDVLALYRHTADGPDVFTSIPETLEAAYRWGLAGVRPVGFAPVDLAELMCHRGGLILAVDLPGPHAVCADGGWWFSWGDLWPPSAWPGAVVEEAWAVQWA